MSKPEIWHLERKRSLWDGSSVAWCGVKFKSGQYVSDFWFIPAGGSTCTGCKQAKKNGK
ncbi:hypothetical protein [Saccharopolyspora terrae]|uniref:hypothetical protein n=1 Tax=Saccharopolyspora terrae TaxID=2530384 RepID=UPI001404735A|nr:hypothetical protein [Saccharopolyspora terrae]